MTSSFKSKETSDEDTLACLIMTATRLPPTTKGEDASETPTESVSLSAETALAKIRAGADLVQLYTGLIYAGPALPDRILAGLAEHCAREGVDHISSLRDSGVDEWAGRRLD